MMAITKEKIKKWEEKGKVKKLIKALKDIDMYIRRKAVAALGEIGDPKAVDPLIGALKDKGNIVRDSTVTALGKIGGPRAVDPLIEALKDNDYGVRRSALKALENIGDAKAVEPLVWALGDNDFMVKKYAFEALVKIGPSAIDALIKGLTDNNADISRESANVLRKIKDAKAAAPLIKALEHINPVVRGGATGVLREIGAPAVDHLIDALDTDNENVHKHAVSANIQFRLYPG
jgi:HEAT repeat protein